MKHTIETLRAIVVALKKENKLLKEKVEKLQDHIDWMYSLEEVR